MVYLRSYIYINYEYALKFDVLWISMIIDWFNVQSQMQRNSYVRSLSLRAIAWFKASTWHKSSSHTTILCFAILQYLNTPLGDTQDWVEAIYYL